MHHPKDIVSQLSECVLPRPRVDRVEKGPRLSDCQRLWQGRRRRAQPLRSHGRHCAVPPRRATWVLRRRVQRRRVPAEHVRNQATRVPDNCNLQCWTWITEQSTVCRRRPDADRRDSHGFARRDGFLGHIPNGLRTWFGVARWNWVARGLRGPHWSRIVPSHRVWHARLTRAAVSGVAVTRGFVCLSLRSVVLMDNSKCARTKK